MKTMWERERGELVSERSNYSVFDGIDMFQRGEIFLFSSVSDLSCDFIKCVQALAGSADRKVWLSGSKPVSFAPALFTRPLMLRHRQMAGINSFLILSPPPRCLCGSSPLCPCTSPLVPSYHLFFWGGGVSLSSDCADKQYTISTCQSR